MVYGWQVVRLLGRETWALEVRSKTCGCGVVFAYRYQSCVVVVSLAGTTTIRSLSTQRRLAGGERTSLLRHRVKFGTRQSRFRWGFLERPDEASVTLFLRPGSLSQSAPNGRDDPRCKRARSPPTPRPPLRVPSSTPGSAAVPSLRCLLYLCASSTINNDNTTTACVTAMYTGMVRGKVNLSSNRHARATFALGERKKYLLFIHTFKPSLRVPPRLPPACVHKPRPVFAANATPGVELMLATSHRFSGRGKRVPGTFDGQSRARSTPTLAPHVGVTRASHPRPNQST